MATKKRNLAAACLLLLTSISLALSLPVHVSASAPVEGQVVLDLGQGWDAAFVWRGAVIYNGSSFMMWYSGEDNVHYKDNIGLATSSDGVFWTRYSENPVLQFGPTNSWDYSSVNEPWVIHENGEYKMWYSGQTWSAALGITSISIGYATSPDGIHWTKSSDNPVLTPGPGGFDAKEVYQPVVVSFGSGYLMYYIGYSAESQVSKIGMAKSTDGVHWTKSGTIDIPKVNGGWDGSGFRYIGGVMVLGSQLIATYFGHPGANVPNRIGVATSTDGVNWTPYSGNPLITSGNLAWDKRGLTDPMLVTVGDKYFIYYSGWDSRNVVRIGLAQLPMSEYSFP